MSPEEIEKQHRNKRHTYWNTKFNNHLVPTE